MVVDDLALVSTHFETEQNLGPSGIAKRQTGIVVESVSSQAFASAIKRYADDRAFLRRCGENALRFAQTELSWPKLGPCYAKVLEQVVTTATGEAERKREIGSAVPSILSTTLITRAQMMSLEFCPTLAEIQIHVEEETRAFRGRAELRSEIGGESREIGRLVACVHAASFDLREV